MPLLPGCLASLEQIFDQPPRTGHCVEHGIMHAVLNGESDEVIRRRLSGRPQQDHGQVLMAAVDCNRPGLAQQLIDAGIDVNAVYPGRDGVLTTPLILACQMARFSLVRALIRAGANVNLGVGEGDQHLTPARAAARAGSISIMRLLIRAHADLNYRYAPYRDSPILCLAMEDDEGEVHDRSELLQLLIAAGAEVNVFDGDRQTPLSHAARFDLIDSVGTLLMAGADPDLADPWGYTPLHLANDSEIVAMLLKTRADINARTQYGETPLMLGILNANEAKVRLLLEAGADWRNLRLTEDFGGFGGTATVDLARFVAEEEGDWTFLELLAEHEAAHWVRTIKARPIASGSEES